MSANRRLPRQLTAALLSGLLLLTVGASGAIAQSQSPDVPVDAPAVVPTPEPGVAAIPVEPDPEIISPVATPWQWIEVAPDGKTLTVYFWNGATGCNGLKDVEVTQVDGVTTVTVYTGLTPEAMNTTCLAALILYSTVVVLDAPVLGGGVS